MFDKLKRFAFKILNFSGRRASCSVLNKIVHINLILIYFWSFILVFFFLGTITHEKRCI